MTANEIEIESTGLGLHVGNNTQDAMAPANRASTIVRAQKTTINAEAVGIGAFSNGLMDISGDLTVNAPNAIDVRGNSTVNINQDGKGVVILNGDIVFETPATPGDAQNSGEKINSYVNLNLTEGSQWNGRAYQEYGNKNPIQTVELENPPFYGNVTGFSVTIDNGAAWNMDGDSFVNTLEVKKGGAVNVQKDAALFNATEIKLSGGVIALEDVDQKLNINTLSGTDGTFNVKAARNSDGSFSKASINVKRVEKGMTITEAYSGVDADGISKSDLTKLRALNAPSGDLTLVQVVPEGDINGTMTYVTDADGTTTSSEVKNTRQDAYESLTSMNFLAWRHEMNDLTKRMGELRMSPQGIGSWARLYGSEQEYGDQGLMVKSTSIQVGADYSVGGGWTVGGAFTYTNGDASYDFGNADSDAYSAAIYGSWLAENGFFVDLIGKYTWMKSDFSLNDFDGQQKNNALSASAEFGWHFRLNDIAFVEPQAEITYGRVFGDSFDAMANSSMRIDQDDFDSLIGRAGLRAGFYIPDNRGTVYARVSGAYDFMGDFEYTASNASTTRRFKEDQGGAWVEYAIGANLNITESTYSYIDLERSSGGDVKENWRWNVGLRTVF